MSNNPYEKFLSKIKHVKASSNIEEFLNRLKVLEDSDDSLRLLVTEMMIYFGESLDRVQDIAIKDSLTCLFVVVDMVNQLNMVVTNPYLLASKEIQKELKEDEEYVRKLVKMAVEETEDSFNLYGDIGSIKKKPPNNVS